MEWFCGQYRLPLGKQTYIMGILNITPDSFSDGGRWSTVEKAAAHALKMAADGAHLIDIGAQSTRPGHTPVTPEAEWERLEPVLKALDGKLELPISVDTYYPQVAKLALEAGASVINDVSGTVQPEMARLAAATGCGWVLMHTGGGTADITACPDGDIVAEVNTFFGTCLAQCAAFAIHPSQLCLDMGIGFGKTYDQNLTLIREHARLHHPHNALLTGLSRKRVIGTATGEERPSARLPGNIAAHTCAIQGGTDILRVHDVAEEAAAARMADTLFRL